MKKVLSVLLAIILIAAVIPMEGFRLTASAASNGVQLKIEKIKKVYSTGTYFTSTGGPHQAQGPDCPDDCMVCSINGIPARGELPSGASMGYSRYNWQCYAFALYCSTYIFGSYFRNWGTVPASSAVVGDVVEFDWDSNGSVDHYALVLYREGTNLVVYDANVDWNCKVSYGSVYSISTVVRVYRAPNYNAINGSGESSITYEKISQGTYGIKNNSTGTYMAVSWGYDYNTQNVDLYNELNAATKMIITSAPTGYKIRPECSASRIINPYGDAVTSGLNVNIYDDVNDSSQWWQFEKVSNGYVIRNVQNSNCVLTVDNGNVIVSNYTGAATQIWTLSNLTHTHSYGSWQVRKAATCVATGVEYRICSCGKEETRTIEKTAHSYKSNWSIDVDNHWHECSVCGVKKDIGVHSWDNGVITTQPSCISFGQKDYTCIYCGWVKYSVLSKTSHTYGNDNICDICGTTTSIAGDINGDSSINNKDLGVLMQYLNGWNVLIVINTADVNDDGAVNNKDYGLLMQYINGWNVKLQ